MRATEFPVVAAFDFDGTVTRRDSLLPFLGFVAGYPALAWHVFRMSPVLASYLIGRTRNDVAKERLLTRVLGGRSHGELLEQGNRFAQQVLPRLLRPEAMERFSWHRSQGHRCVLVTASLECYVTPWARAQGFHDILATRIEVAPEGRVTGRLLGRNCYGEEKRRRLEELIGPRAGYQLYVYGDSRGDHELLACADFAYYRNRPWTGEPAE
jgi:HAD superfamily hydrolase (TIGR01490 family)